MGCGTGRSQKQLTWGTMRWRRVFSTTPALQRRVLCSVKELKQYKGNALKFPLSVVAETTVHASETVKTARAVRGGRTGFVFFCERSQAPRAFINSCPHALLELDLDDSDFFCDGFVQCKAHGAFFDPLTGICLQGPAAARRGRFEKQLGALTELRVKVEGSDVVLVPSSEPDQLRDDRTEQEWRDYRAARQRELARVLAAREDDVLRMQDDLHAKTMESLRQYRTQSSTTTKPKPDKSGES